jgi:hypothetical protein
MGRRKKSTLPFDSKGGTLMIPRRMLESPVWKALSAQTKVLLVLMQIHWRNDDAVGYGVREAMAKIPCAKGTAQKAFIEAQEAGFIVMVDHSLFNSREQSKTRTWRLTWMPWKSKAPTQDWENKSTGANIYPLNMPQGQICTPESLKYGSQG